MESNNFKSPKKNKKSFFGEGSEPVLWGTMITLIAAIGLLGKGPIGAFLTYITVYLFGAFYFLFYILLIILGIYLIIKRRVIKIHISMTVLGGIFFLISCLIASSCTSSSLSLSNFVQSYNNNIDLIRISRNTFELDISQVGDVGGGFCGYFLSSLLNTTITASGTIVVYVTLGSIGLVLMLKNVVVYLIDFFKSLKNKPVKKVSQPNLKKDENSEKIERYSFSSPYRDFDVKKDEDTGTKLLEKAAEEEKVKIKEESTERMEFSKSSDIYDDEEDLTFTKTSFFVNDFDDSLTSNSKGEKAPSYRKDEPSSLSPEEKMHNNMKNDDLSFAPYSSFVEEDRKLDEEDKEKEEEVMEFSSSTFDDEIVSSNKINTNEETKISSSYTYEVPYQKEEIKPINKEERQYIYPPISLLKNRSDDTSNYENIQIANERLHKINELFEQFKIGARVISYSIGPSVTRFNVKMDPGVKVNVLSTIQNEIAIKLGGNKTVRIDLIVEGQETSAIEVGNVKAIPVSFRECVASIASRTSEKDKLLVPLGKDISGEIVTVNIDELPHLLVAGTTGSGKSVFINTIITTLIMRNKPDELKLMLIDPKKVEFSKYNGLPHLLCPVITEAVDGKTALQRLVDEMERRYSLFLEKGRGATKLSEYAEIARDKGYEIPPSIVMVCDEFSDFMTDYRKEIEVSVKRLAQKARAAGIYLIICTQRPSVQVITGDIKAVVPSRIGLSVPSVVDSRTILDEGGAESLLGNGDMLARVPRHNTLLRVQGSYVSTSEVADIIDFIAEQREPHFDPHFLNLSLPKDASMFGGDPSRKGKDELHEQAKEHVMRTKVASTSNLQSKFGIGYARADHILYCLEEEGIVKRVSGNRRIVVKTLDDEGNIIDGNGAH